MALADFVARLETYKARLAAWEGDERARARQAGKALSIERQGLIDQASQHGAARRAVAKDLPKPDIGPQIAVERDEGAPVLPADATASLSSGPGIDFRS